MNPDIPQEVRIVNAIAEQLFDVWPVSIVMIDLEDRIWRMNKQMSDELQQDADIIGKPVVDMLEVVQDRENVLPRYLQDLHEGRQSIIHLSSNCFMLEPKRHISFLIQGALMGIYEENRLVRIVLYYRNVLEESTRKHLLNIALSRTQIFQWSYDMERNLMIIDPRYFEYLGIPTRDYTLTPEEFAYLMHPDDRQSVFDALTLQLDGSLYEAPVEYRLRRDDGSWEWFEAQSTYVGQLKETPFRVVGICMSTQKYKDTEERLNEALRKARRSDELKSIFLANMSHEIRTPLNAIVGFSSLLAYGESDLTKEDIIEFTSLIEKNSRLLMVLISDILDLSKIESNTMEFSFCSVSLHRVLNEIGSAQRINMREGVELLLDLPGQEVTVYTDPARLSQVINNLVNNAIKFTSEGNIRIGYRPAASGYVNIFVEDTGTGMSREVLEHIFDRFYKGDSFKQGTLILAVLYLLDKNIKLRERIAKTALLVLIYASFDVNVLNYIWHGFHVQNGLPNRFAFIYIFLMLTMAFDAWRHMHKFKVWQVLLAMAVPLAFAIYSAVTGLGERELYTYGITIGLLILYGMAMLIYRLGKMHREVFRSLFFFLAAVEMVSYAIFGVFCNGTVGRSTYLDEQIAYEKTTERQEGRQGNQDNFYRSEIDSNRMRDENMFLGADGVVLFSSTMPAATVDMCKGLGIEARTNKNGYNGFTKLVNDIFGVKYVLSSRGTNQLYQMEKVDQEGDMNLYKNSGALSLGFMVKDDIIDWTTDSTDHFEVQNDFVTMATGMDEDLFELEETIDMEDGGTYTIVLPAGKQVYLDVTSSVSSIEITTPDYTRTYDTYNDHLYDLGCFDAIDNATVTCTFKENQSGPVTAEVWTCDQELYQQVHDELAKSQLQLTKFEDGKFEGTVEAAEDGVLMLSLPYDEGWSVKIDGEDDDYYMIGDALTGVDVTEGTHTITFEYTPEGLWKGTWISLICVALYLLTSAIWIRKGKKPELSSAGDAFEEYDFENGQAEKDADEKDETAEETVSADQADADTGDIQEGDGEDHGI